SRQRGGPGMKATKRPARPAVTRRRIAALSLSARRLSMWRRHAAAVARHRAPYFAPIGLHGVCRAAMPLSTVEDETQFVASGPQGRGADRASRGTACRAARCRGAKLRRLERKASRDDLIVEARSGGEGRMRQGRHGRPIYLEKEPMRMLSLFAAAVVVTAPGAFAHDRWGNPNWIANERLVSPIDGSHCCGVNDCVELSSDEVQETNGGYFLRRLNELVPFREVQVSRDGVYWRCKKPDGSRRCFFAPPPSI